MKHQLLHRLEACRDAVEFAERFHTLDEAWAKCERGDWMLWLAWMLAGNPRSKGRRKLALASTACARTAWPYVRKRDRKVVRKCYETTEAWGRGEPGVTLKDVRAAADATWAAVWATAEDAARAAAGAAAWAAAMAAAWAAAVAAARDAGDAAYAVARAKTLAKCANIVREFYPQCPTRSKP